MKSAEIVSKDDFLSPQIRVNRAHLRIKMCAHNLFDARFFGVFFRHFREINVGVEFPEYYFPLPGEKHFFLFSANSPAARPARSAQLSPPPLNISGYKTCEMNLAASYKLHRCKWGSFSFLLLVKSDPHTYLPRKDKENEALSYSDAMYSGSHK